MKRFNLDEYLKNPTRKVVTGTGANVRIICTDRKNTKCPIVALIEDEDKPDEVRTYTKNGDWSVAGDETPFNLFFAPEKHEGWAHIFRDATGNSYMGLQIFESKEAAEKDGEKYTLYVTTVKIEWEE